MIEEIAGNLLATDAQALVNAVNCVGVMGKGLALQFRRRFSEDYFEDYKAACRRGEMRIGKVRVHRLKIAGEPKFIVDFPTKNHWREKSRLADIESGLDSLVEEIEKYKIESIALPALGCGLGGLNWNDVRPLIAAAFADFPDVEVRLFPPRE